MNYYRPNCCSTLLYCLADLSLFLLRLLFTINKLKQIFIKKTTSHGAGSKMHEDKIARGDKIARRDKIARGENCTKGQICTKTFLHEDKFARGDKIARRVKFARATNLHGESNLHGCQICTG